MAVTWRSARTPTAEGSRLDLPHVSLFTRWQPCQPVSLNQLGGQGGNDVLSDWSGLWEPGILTMEMMERSWGRAVLCW